MKKVILIGLGLVVLESFLGFTTAMYGYYYRDYDRESAEEMMLFIRQENPTYYDLLNDASRPRYRELFQAQYTEEGKPIMVIIGSALILMAIGASIPLLVFLYMIENSVQFRLLTTERKEQEGTEQSTDEQKEQQATA